MPISKKTKKFDDLRKKMKPAARKKAKAGTKKILAKLEDAGGLIQPMNIRWGSASYDHVYPKPAITSDQSKVEFHTSDKAPVANVGQTFRYNFKYKTTPKPGQVDDTPLPKLTLWQRFKNLFNQQLTMLLTEFDQVKPTVPVADITG